MSKKLLILVSADVNNGLGPKRTNLLGPGLAVDFPEAGLAAGDAISINGCEWLVATLDQRAAYTPAHGHVNNVIATCVAIRETSLEFWSPGKKPVKPAATVAESLSADPLEDLSPGV